MKNLRDRAIEAIVLGMLIAVALLVGTPVMGRALSSVNSNTTIHAQKVDRF